MRTYPLLIQALISIVLTTIANLIILFIGKPLTGVPVSFKTLSPMPVLLWSVLGTVGAAVVYAIVRRFSTNPQKVFVSIALVVLVLSFIPDLLLLRVTSGMFAGATVGGVILLMLMHIVAAGISMYLLLRATPAKHV